MKSDPDWLKHFKGLKGKAVEVKSHNDLPILNKDEIAIYLLTDGTKLVVANCNLLGGVCDDCRDFGTDQVVAYEKRRIKL